jgi:superfamily I DNA and/or RNA helicase/SAM-dependent methyltransferase
MALQIYKIGEFDHLAEKQQFEKICSLLQDVYNTSDENCIFIANYNIGGVELDGLLFKNDAIILVEFKNRGGKITARENGDWLANGRTIDGGANKKNPFIQIRINKSRAGSSLKHFLERETLDIQGVIVFNQSSVIDTSQLSPIVKSWLHICDNDHFITTLKSIHNREKLFGDEELLTIEHPLNLSEFLLFSTLKTIPHQRISRNDYDISSAIIYYQDILDLWEKEDGSIKSKYKELYRIFNEAIKDKSKHSKLGFSGPFARMDYLCKEYNIVQGDFQRINSFRAKCREIDSKDGASLQEDYPYDVKTLVEFIDKLYKEPPFKTLTACLPKEYKKKDSSVIYSKDYIRVAVDSWNEDYIYGKTSDEKSELIKIDYTKENYSGNWGYIKELLTENTQLNIVHPNIENNIYYPELIIFEPDFLVDISSIANCFEHYGATHLTYLINKIKPSPNRRAFLLGNLAGQLLDEVSYTKGKEKLIPYSQSAQNFFKRNSLQLATCEDMNETFHHDARSQKNNIESIINAFDEEIKSFSNGDMLVEPSFFCEMLGIQGRMDLLQTDMKFLLEQKSGQRAFNSNAHVEKHYVQMLLYQAILHYNFGLKNDEITSFLLYSKYADGAIKEGPAPKLLFSALKIRNEIVKAEKAYSNGAIGEELRHLTPEKLNIKNVSGTLWERYTTPELNELLAPIHHASDIEIEYFSRFLTFLEKEHLLSKAGNNTKETSGFATTWNSTLDEKKLAGNIYESLSIVAQKKSEGSESYDIITLQTPIQEDYFLPNFRVGDIVILYSYKQNAEPDARKRIVFRGNIKEIRSDKITVVLRSPQRNESIFKSKEGWCWAIEHDFFESSFNSLYRAVYSFLTANKERKELILNQRKARIDTQKRLNGDYKEFNEMVLKAKQSQDYFLLIGPPGTGKTTFGLVNILQEELSDTDSSILIASYTNRAVDEICQKLLSNKIPFIRIGSELSTDSTFQDYLLSNQTRSCKNVAEIKKLIREIRVIVGTTTAISSNITLFMIKRFSLAIIDEASQILEPHLLALLCAKHKEVNAIDKFVLIGDHKQLPAVVQQSELDSRVSEPSLIKIGLTNCRNSLFERFIKLQKDSDDFKYMLCKQGRMHPDVSLFPNHAFYQMKLQPIPLEHQKNKLFFPVHSDSNGIEQLLSSRRLAFIVSHNPEKPASTKTNLPEAKIIAATVHSLWQLYTKNGKPFDDKTVGVIVPYRNQISMIRKEIDELGIEELHGVTIDTVERYQGSQRDVIIYGFTIQKHFQLDFLTSNVFEEDGYIIDRKLNVALTRAKEQLILVGNPLFLNSDFTFYKLIEFIRSKQGYFDVLTNDYCEGNFSVTPLIKEYSFANAIYNLDPKFEKAFNNKILVPIKNDSRTEWPLLILGNEADVNKEIIGYGRGDFSNQLNLFEKETISAEDKVLLYGFYNMRMHYCSAKAIFESYRDLIQNHIDGHKERVYFFDIGCGPGTAGFAFADTFQTTKKLNYIGIDISIPMMQKAEELLSEEGYEFLNCKFIDSLHKISENKWEALLDVPTLIILNYSYLFANVDIHFAEQMAHKINKLVENYPLNTYLIINQNSPNDRLNQKYYVFRKFLNEQFITKMENKLTFSYRISNDVKQFPFYYEIISNRL